MNTIAIRFLISFRHEICIVFGVIGILFSLPFIAIAVIANAGLPVAAASLVSTDPVSHVITVRDPSGNPVTQLQATTVWPVGGVVTLEFGQGDPPYQVSHTGIDIADPQGKIGRPITVFMAGTVTKVVDVDNEYGKYIFVDHGNNIQSQYWHINQALVTVGQHVEPGDVIAYEGKTGHATGPHLHFQINVFGVPVNPRSFEAGDPPSGQ